jgi:hypothetical protein
MGKLDSTCTAPPRGWQRRGETRQTPARVTGAAYASAAHATTAPDGSLQQPRRGCVPPRVSGAAQTWDAGFLLVTVGSRV